MSMKQKKTPLRKCIVCNEKLPKKELLRIVKQDAALVFDKSGKINGRGAYVCTSNGCLEKASNSKQINHLLGLPLSEKIIEEMKEFICIEEHKEV